MINNKLLFLNRKSTDTLIERTKTRPQEVLEFKLNKQMETYSFSPTIKFSEKGKLLLDVTSFEATDFVSNIAAENNDFFDLDIRLLVF